MHFWPLIGKAKMCLRMEQFLGRFWFSKILKKIKFFGKSSNFFISLGRIRTRDLLYISLDTNPLDHGSMTESLCHFSLIYFTCKQIAGRCKQIVPTSNTFWLDTLYHYSFIQIGSTWIISCNKCTTFAILARQASTRFSGVTLILLVGG